VKIKFIYAVIALLLSSSSLFGEVDFILKSFNKEFQAKKELERLREFTIGEEINGISEVKRFGDIWYLKFGTFGDNVRNDEKFLALFATKYPNMMIVEHKNIIEQSHNPERKNYSSNYQKSSFWAENGTLLQWLLFLIMTVWGGVIIYLRFKTVKRVGNEQREILKQQSSIETNLKQEGL
jgi:hypothetical protein